MPYQILDYRDIPNPIAKKILEEYFSKLSSTDIVSESARSAFEYLQTLTTICEPDKAEELAAKLREFKLKDITIVLIINILPKTIDELRMLLSFETVIPDEGALSSILELIDKYCG